MNPLTQKASGATSESPGAWGLDALVGRFVELRGAAGAAAMTIVLAPPAARLLLTEVPRPVVAPGQSKLRMRATRCLSTLEPIARSLPKNR